MILTKTASTYILGALAGAAVALTPELLTAIGAIAVAIITAVGAVIVNILVAKNVAKLKELAQENLSETKVVQGHVNSAAAAATQEIAGLRKELTLMQSLAADKDKTAALLAQSAATVPANTPKTSLT